MTRARLLDDVHADLTTRTRELEHARPCFAFTVLILIRQRCMRLSDFGLINHSGTRTIATTMSSYDAVAADATISDFHSFKLQQSV
ncbi:BZ3500_MvSof-1268-A1-R1_Chr8-2g10297 [Microbotryum saponariae]|uniref:BZ3500_MvSof-1268-A1-R1_Chr8-2g10297 protein n=1 Tax=Microbotryum saponariae TaxID=289078 RepID=A0A2X0KVX3_9BASI|nr:BZ3500_MvSof-1268-A1-R1_Chr8-2g10297 [Microbotryum saponariae]SDA02127.1 BZ3501_MvSof-1269-A2-R1_Chr8-2g10046 [Microbotryum saponariae]